MGFFFFIIFLYIIIYFSTLINIVSLLGLLFISINIIISSLMVICATNPLNSLWFFIFILLNIAIFGMVIGLEFFILILITLYLGAISIFFLFMIMLLNIKIINLSQNLNSRVEYFIFGILLFQILLFFFNFLQITMLKNEILSFTSMKFNFFTYYYNMYSILGQFLYTYYATIFILLAIFLLIIMIGTIILTQEDRDLTKKKVKDLSLIKRYEKCIFLKIIK